MSSVFLLQNQDKLLLNKQGEWVDGRDAASLFRSEHRDEAVNQMVEVNARDYTLRIRLLECSLTPRGLPRIEEQDLPPLMRYQDSGAANDAECGEPAEADPAASDVSTANAELSSRVFA